MTAPRPREQTYLQAVPDTDWADELPLNHDGGDDTCDGMEADNRERLARIEGALPAWKWGTNLVSAFVIGAAGLILTVIVFGFGIGFNMIAGLGTSVSEIQAEVRNLPEEINENLLELNRTLSGAITATRAVDQPPAIVVVPQTALTGAVSADEAPSPVPEAAPE